MKRKVNYQIGALKRRYKTGTNVEPGAFISKLNESKIIKKDNESVSKKKISIMGLV